MIAFTDAVTILMIEDDDGHARLIDKNIRRAGLTNEIIHLRSGNETLDFLFGEPGSRYHDASKPFVILLDLNLPDMAGTDILRQVKSSAAMRRAPVIVLTTADDKLEVERCYDLGCNIYMTKPLLYQRFAGAIRQLGGFLAAIQVPEPV